MPVLPLQGKRVETRKIAMVLRAINHPLREKMLTLLSEKTELNVTNIHLHFNVDQAVASQHLKILRQARVVTTQRKGKEVFYKPDYKNLASLERFVEQVLAEIF